LEIRPRILKAFCAVVDTGSLVLAGGQVALSASAISRIISQLEADLGVILFDRTERRLVPTAAGREFHRRAREALPLFDDLASFGRRTGTVQSPPLRVAALSRHAESIIAPALAGLMASEPGFGPIQLDVHAQRDFGFSRLARPFDIGFGNLAGSHPDLAAETLALAPIVVAMPPDHALAALERVPPAALRAHSLIQLTRDTVIGAIVRETLDVASLDLRPAAEVSHTYVAPVRTSRQGAPCLFWPSGQHAASRHRRAHCGSSKRSSPCSVKPPTGCNRGASVSIPDPAQCFVWRLGDAWRSRAARPHRPGLASTQNQEMQP
jgi:DNA-binding transcriptional LysR family regulator